MRARPHTHTDGDSGAFPTAAAVAAAAKPAAAEDDDGAAEAEGEEDAAENLHLSI